MKLQIIRRDLNHLSAEGLPGLHPVLARVYAARGVCCLAEVDYALAGLHPFGALSGIDAAVDLLIDSLHRGHRMLVIGDFDADGATSCATALRVLRHLGVAEVAYLVPNRFEYGYGLTPAIVEVAARRGADLLITVDNGMTSLEGVAHAQRLGMRVLVTDHHLPGSQLPGADAIVNPNGPGDGFPSKHLAGVGVIFYVLIALRARLREAGWFAKWRIAEPNLAQVLDLVALGTVADVVPLDRNNRILVAQGLERIRSGRCQPGVRALLQVAGRDPQQATTADLAFGAAPRLNAAGRLQDMSLGIECLLADEPGRALEMAHRLDRLNRDRRRIEDGMLEEALALLEQLSFERAEEQVPCGLCLFDQRWHQGVIGILAARIKERFHRPVVAFAADGSDEVKGSARSIAGLHIRDVIDAVAVREPGLISRFGGHAMAAGLTLKRSDVERFAAAFEAEVQHRLSADHLQPILYSDGPLMAEEFDLALAESIQRAGPWGPGFTEPVFDGRFKVLQQRIVGERHLKLTLEVPGTERRVGAIAFNAEVPWQACSSHVDIAYKLAVNHYQGSRSVQLIVEHLQLPC
ncbi:MAG: single-stranded-DNA-specific exonuclease RecJ [Gammaproteobacteria bacterium]